MGTFIATFKDSGTITEPWGTPQDRTESVLLGTLWAVLNPASFTGSFQFSDNSLLPC